MEKNLLKNTLWIFNHPNPETIPSYYVSGLMPAHFMNIKKIIFLENHNPHSLIDKFKPKCIIISKAFSLKISELVEIARKKGIIVISIFDDWVFENKNRTKLNLPIAKNSDYIITKTIYADEEIQTNTGIKSKIIPDPIRFQTSKVIKNITLPLKLCWFGMHTNHKTILSELTNLDNTNLKIELSIISNYFEDFVKSLNKMKLKNINIKFKIWNNKSNLDIIESDIVLLPYPKDNKRLVKSSNRIIDSLNLGRFTILSKVKQFKEFEKFTFFGNLSDGLFWILDNKEKSYEITTLGQKYVNENYSIDSVCTKWFNLFDEIKERI